MKVVAVGNTVLFMDLVEVPGTKGRQWIEVTRVETDNRAHAKHAAEIMNEEFNTKQGPAIILNNVKGDPDEVAKMVADKLAASISRENIDPSNTKWSGEPIDKKDN